MIATTRNIQAGEDMVFPLLKRETVEGLLQGHLAALLGMPDPSLSLLIRGMGLERQTLSRLEAKALKGQGVIHPNSRGGNFLSKATVYAILKSVNSVAARHVECQIFPKRKLADKDQVTHRAGHHEEVP
ncbi:MAG: hypothetical protein M3Q07_19080 [Pseudobdellovibrionaceae bacterium]|nr:hypothetical protein [Pseudobdellovibrionaceae bacterium]